MFVIIVYFSLNVNTGCHIRIIYVSAGLFIVIE